ncbi:hypothetical protein [Cohnella cholangitidis]|uniref:Uncharacterized protein n=1 Tax=Cohnella cholangitidis TaxID=2598458 RepID=A0A7G5C5D7_9BACL|nr:hypothetical protein [Cohnella cholangitidis]QMV44421.1 hypothetical protein FPL14_27085 [Cohnella cholangitidis]
MEDKDLFDQLKRGPLIRNGFDEELRRRINENLDKPNRRAIRPLLVRWGAVSTSFLLIVAVVIGLWSWKTFTGDNASKETLSTEQASASQQASPDREINPIPHSAVVIGLRADKDQSGMSSSSYRTIMVAPEREKLTFIRSGQGIWMPYKTNFWKIDAVPDAQGKGNETLEALKSGVRKEKIKVANEPTLARTNEKLLYAGNQFVSVLQNSNVNEDGVPVEQSDVWINEVSNLAPEARGNQANALKAGNFTLAQALGANAAEPPNVDQWVIARDAGNWVAKQPAGNNGLTTVRDIQSWPALSVQLTKAIVKDDPLALSWDEVRSLEPRAIDAYTSQDEDIAVIVTDSSIKLIPYQLPEEEMKDSTVTVSLRANESVVMVQWATQEKYVESWKLLFDKWFEASAE